MKGMWALLAMALFLVACTEKAAEDTEKTANERNETPNVTQTEETITQPKESEGAIFLTEEQKKLREVKSLVNFSEFYYEDCDKTIKEYDLKFDDAVNREEEYEDELKEEQANYDKIKLELELAEDSGDEREIRRQQSRFETANEDLDDAEDDFKEWKKYRDRVFYTLEEVKLECQRMEALINANTD